MSDKEREPGFYWIKATWLGGGDRWEPAEWQSGGWVEGSAGIWHCLATEIPIYEVVDLAAVTVGERIKEPR